MKLKLKLKILLISLLSTQVLFAKDELKLTDFTNITNYDKNIVEQCIKVSSERNNVPEIIIKSIIGVENSNYYPYAINCNTNIRPYTSSVEKNYKRYVDCDENVDIGVMQINYKVWKKEYPTISTTLMLDPCVNVELGTRILKSHYKETKDWMKSIGYYHSRTPEHYLPYQSLVSSKIVALNNVKN